MAQSDQRGKNTLYTALMVVVSQVGCLTLIIILAAVFGGLWLDRTFGTKPVFTLTLLVVSVPVSVVVMLVVARRTTARLKEQAQTDKDSDTSS